MALVPLYDQNGSDGSHHVRAPGGYETWRLWSYGPQLDVVSVISIWNGYPHDPDYIKAYRSYCKRPTKSTPPLPGHYACQEIACFGAGAGILTSVMGRTERVESFPALECKGIKISSGGTDLNVRAVGSPSLSMTTRSASHHWALTSPLVMVSADVKTLPRETMGFCDHRYGDSPLNSDFFLDGCAFFPSGIFAFQATPTTSWIVHLTTTTTKLIDQPLDYSPRRSTFWRTGAPRTITLVEHVTLNNPTRVASQWSRLRLMYDARSGNETGRAFCEISAPIDRPWIHSFARRPSQCNRPITWSPLPPADKPSPSAPERARGPSSSPCSQNPEHT